MGLKTIEYYESLDLEKASQEIRASGKDRSSLGVFCDAVNALYFKIKGGLSVVELASVLGDADVEIDLPEGKSVKEYKWEDEHDGVPYSSSTKFLVEDGRVVGLYKDIEE